MKRVLTGRFMHETNTFSVQETDMALWRRRDFHRDNEIPVAFRGTRSALGATFEAADKYRWTLIHPVSANANPSGIVTDDAFEQIGGMILDAAERQRPIDGVLLHLHGAMVVASYEDGEGELLARLRKSLGPEIPIVVTLDLHANVTQAMADNASASVSSCRVNRRPLAPNAMRMPSSRRRNTERASIAPATFAQAITSTSTTPAPSAPPIVR